MPKLKQNICEEHASQPGLYIHIPFCRTKCPYCGFYSIVSTAMRPVWMKALKREITLYRDCFKSFDTIYLGGGTPSLLSSAELEELMECLNRNLNFSHDTEITIECNPGDMDDEKISAFKSLGINRINLGVQSFNDEDLVFLGRRHSALEAETAVKRLRSDGFDNIGVDLIYGLKTQNKREWLNNLEKAVSYAPEHISCYELTIEEGTLFEKHKKAGKITLPDEESERDLFIATSQFLEKRGYIHYEISNFSIDESHMSRHNQKYWKRSPYLGLGPSSHSFRESKRWWNHRSVKKYCEDLEQAKLPVAGSEILNRGQEFMEIVSLGLRTREGFDMCKLENRSGIKPALLMLEKEGYLKIEGNRVVPTKKGFLVADRLPLYLEE